MAYPGHIFLLMHLVFILLISAVNSGPVRLSTAVRTHNEIQQGIAKWTNDGGYFGYIAKAQTQLSPPEFRIEKGPNGQLWEVVIRKVVHVYAGRRRLLPSSASGQTAVLPRTQTLSVSSVTNYAAMPQSCECEPSHSRSSGWCWYFPRKNLDYCMRRPCRLKFVCTSRKTGLICLLRKTTSKVVPISYSRCVEERVHGFIYTLSSAY